MAHALGATTDALVNEPNNPDLEFARGVALYSWGRYHEARDSLKRAASLGCTDESLFLRLGWCHYHTANVNEAEKWMSQAVRAAPNSCASHYGAGITLRAQKRIAEAAAAFSIGLQCDPNDFDCLIALGVCQLDMGNAADAEVQFRRAIVRDENRPGAWSNLGAALCATEEDNRDAALRAFERADSLERETGENVDNAVNMGALLQSQGRSLEAIEFYERVLATESSVGAHANYAHSLLAAGRWAEGWTHYEFRWLRNPLLSLRPRFDRPAWDGQDLNGKTILLRIEQGFGDAIQFIRFAPDLKALGATVLLRVGPGFADLARGFAGVDRVLEENEPAPEFDFYLHLLSLPRVLGLDLKSLPRVGAYLEVDVERAAQWAPRLAVTESSLRVGLVWAGSPAHGADRHRSISLQELAPLGGVHGVAYFSLQKGNKEAEARNPPEVLNLSNLGPELRDFSDTAAVIEQLDLVVCVDTAVGHLAGAIGKPVWLMVPESSDWRWLDQRDDTPWYPSMRLFRQSKRGDWSDVVDRIKRALEDLVRTNSTATIPVEDATSSCAPFLRTAAPDHSNLAGHRPGFSAVAETRHGILQYFPDDLLVGTSLRWYGEYLEGQLLLLARMIERGAVVMEVGAGIGGHAVMLGSALSPEGHLFLYEGRSRLRRVLRQNLGANGVTNVTIMPHILRGENLSIAEDGVINRGWADSPMSTQIGSETLDQLKLERLNWLKINERVAALDVLHGGTETIWRLRPRLFVASASESDFKTIVDHAKALSYRCWRVQTPLFNATNFNRREGDIFEGVTALAVLGIPEEQAFDGVPEAGVEM